jgi:hypothetical protein
MPVTAANASSSANILDIERTDTWAHLMEIRADGSAVFAIQSGNVGIGLMSPTSKLEVTGGDAYIQTQGKGLILRDTDGSGCHRITVNSGGTITATAVSCP